MRLVLIAASLMLLTACVPPDNYKPTVNAQKLAQSLQVYEEGMGHQKGKEYKEAIPCFTKAIELDPNFTEAYIARADAYTETRQPQKALADLDKVFEQAPKLQNEPSAIYLYRDSAVCHTALGQWEKVLADCNKMISFNPRYAFAYMARSIAYDNLKKPELAKKDADTYENLTHPLGDKR